MKSNIFVFTLFFAWAPSAIAQYTNALPGYRYEFPRDYFNHEDYQTEWWYTTGNLTASDGRRYGFELTFFRYGVNRDPEKTQAWDIHDLYLAHLALSDLDGGKFYHAERTRRPGPGLAGVSQSQKRIWNGNWELRWTGENEIQLQATDARFSLSLTLSPEKPPVIHGENGVSQKATAAGRASHYLSLTRLSTWGRLALNGKTISVRGSSWMDHEFFTNQLEANQIGWNWLSIQLDDNTEVMLYQFRRNDGSRDPFSAGTYVDAEGKATHLSAADFQLTPTGETWISPITSAKYPVAWTTEVPELGLRLSVTTRLESQEVSSSDALTPNYWEGAIAIEGTRDGKSMKGVGYLEMTGYDRPYSIGKPD